MLELLQGLVQHSPEGRSLLGELARELDDLLHLEALRRL
jgi:hypothetical protein